MSTFYTRASGGRRLIEEVTDYFRARYDALAPQPRKVLDTLASMEGPATPTEIARAARVPVQTVNAQLQRLRDHVERVKSMRKRETRYDVTERLFRIWRQTASAAGRRRFRLLAELLEVATFLSDCRSRQDKVGMALGSFERAWLFAVAGRTSEALPALEQVVAPPVS